MNAFLWNSSLGEDISAVVAESVEAGVRSGGLAQCACGCFEIDVNEDHRHHSYQATLRCACKKTKASVKGTLPLQTAANF